MRILQICTEFGPGGIARLVIDLADWLREAGHQVRFAGSPGLLLDEDRHEPFQPLALVDVSGAGGNIVRRLANAIRCAHELRKYLENAPVQLIHAHESTPALVSWIATWGKRIPILLTYHGSEPGRIRGFGRIARIAADRVITPSRRCAEQLHRPGGIPHDKLGVIGLGVKPAPRVDEGIAAQTRTRLLGDTGVYLVVIVARANYQKGLDILVEVVARRIVQNRQDIQFVVVGGGPILDETRLLAENKGVASNLHFVGHIDTPYVYLTASDVFLLTSRWEALPISIVEALRAGLPIIAADTGGVSELVDASVGEVVPVGDVDRFAHSLLRICLDDDLRSRMSAAAIQHSQEDRFSPEYIHPLYEKQYREMIGEQTNLPSADTGHESGNEDRH